MKIKAMVEIEVTLTDAEWEQIKIDYASNWSEDIKHGSVPKEVGAEDAWNMMVINDPSPTDFEIAWEGFEDVRFIND